MNDEFYDDDDEIEYAVRPNKTAIKRDIAEISKLAEQICALSESQIQSLNFEESLYNAILETAKMPPKAARKRQLKFITAQLRKLDLDPVVEQINHFKSKSIHAVREHHQAELWRDRLLGDDGHNALTELLKKFPAADRQHLRQLQRNAKKEAESSKPPKSARLLYREIRALIEQPE